MKPEPTTPAPASARPIPHRVALAIGALAAVWFVVAAWPILTDPYVLNYGEGLNLHAANQLRRGELPYSDINAAPYGYYCYPPLYPLAGAGFVALFGNSLFSLRLMTLLAEIAVVVFAFRLLRRLGTAKPNAVVHASILAAVLAANKFHGLARVDFLELALVVAALDAAFGVLAGGRFGRMAAVAALTALAAFTKPTSLVLLGVAGIFALALAARRATRLGGLRLAGALAVGAGLYGLGVLVLNMATGGQFLLHTYEFQRLSGFFPGHEVALAIADIAPGALLVGGAGLVVGRGRWLLRATTVAALGWAWFATHKHGADTNYHLTSITLLVLVGALALEQRVRGRAHPWVLALAAAALVVPPMVRGKPELAPMLSAEGVRERKLVHDFTASVEGPILVEEPFFTTSLDRPVEVNDPFQIFMLSQRGRFDTRAFADRIYSGHYRWLIVGERLVGIPAVRAVGPHCLVRRYTTRTKLLGNVWMFLEYRRKGEPETPLPPVLAERERELANRAE